MDIKAFDAARAYANALGRDAAPSDVSAPKDGSSFADLLTSAMGNAREATQASESFTAMSLNKEADLMDVVAAVNNAELAVETVVAVRDKVINAYNEIIRMPI